MSTATSSSAGATCRLAAMIALLLASVTANPVLAQKPKVYRCGPGGTTYSQTPCPAGSEVDAADPRDASQRREAADAAARQKSLAHQLEDERRQREKSAVGQQAVRIGPAAASAASAPASHARHGKAKRAAGHDQPMQYQAPNAKP